MKTNKKFYLKNKAKALVLIALSPFVGACSSDSPDVENDPNDGPKEKPEWQQQNPIHPDAEMKREINSLQKNRI